MLLDMQHQPLEGLGIVAYDLERLMEGQIDLPFGSQPAILEIAEHDLLAFGKCVPGPLTDMDSQAELPKRNQFTIRPSGENRRQEHGGTERRRSKYGTLLHGTHGDQKGSAISGMTLAASRSGPGLPK